MTESKTMVRALYALWEWLSFTWVLTKGREVNNNPRRACFNEKKNEGKQQENQQNTALDLYEFILTF